MVYLPEQRILFAGDVAFYYVTPAGHNGQLTGGSDALHRIDRMDVDVIVPAMDRWEPRLNCERRGRTSS
jgi:glyoxylase-like metal-dependent hydrolase (beta-lactamase superfamily II)